MGGAVDAVFTAIFVAIFVKAALDKVAVLVRSILKSPGLELPWLAAVAVVLGGVLSWFLQLNVFLTWVPDPLIGRLLTAVAVGLGVDFLNDMLAVSQGRTGLSAPRALVVGASGKVRGW